MSAARDRAQVLLVGAVVVALAVLALVVVLNSTVVTETSGDASAVGAVDAATEFTYEVRRNAKSIAVRTSLGENYTDADAVRADLAAAMGNYSDLLAASVAAEHGAHASVRLAGVPENGSRVRQLDDRTFVDGGGAGSWDVVDGTTELGWFVLNLNATLVSETSPLVATASNGSATARYAVRRNGSTGSLRVTATVDGATVTRTCSPSGGRVALDLVSGRSATGGCTVPGLDGVEGPLTGVGFENGTQAKGVYELVVENATATTVGTCAGGAPPCRGPVPWSTTLDVTYRDGSLSYEHTLTSDVYGGRR